MNKKQEKNYIIIGIIVLLVGGLVFYSMNLEIVANEDFESQSFGIFDLQSGTNSVVNTVAHSGSWSYEFPLDANNMIGKTLPADASSLTIQYVWMASDMPASGNGKSSVVFWDSGWHPVFGFGLWTTFSSTNNWIAVGDTSFEQTQTILPNTWYGITIQYDATYGQAIIKINDIELGRVTVSTPIRYIHIGSVNNIHGLGWGNAGVGHIDDFYIETDTPLSSPTPSPSPTQPPVVPTSYSGVIVLVVVIAIVAAVIIMLGRKKHKRGT